MGSVTYKQYLLKERERLSCKKLQSKNKYTIQKEISVIDNRLKSRQNFKQMNTGICEQVGDYVYLHYS